MAVDSQAFRGAMRFWTTGVTVVSAQHGADRHGMTVSSFTSVTLVPPRVLVSLKNDTRTCQLVRASGAFGITILATDQAEISDLFAGRVTEDNDRFSGLEVQTLVSGAPLLKDGLAWLDCRVSSSIDMGTNTIFVGDVLAVKNEAEKPPLVYFNRGYRKLED